MNKFILTLVLSQFFFTTQLFSLPITLPTIQPMHNFCLQQEQTRNVILKNTKTEISQVEAGRDVTINSGNDTTIKGSTIDAGNNIAIIAGNNLAITPEVVRQTVDQTTTSFNPQMAIPVGYQSSDSETITNIKSQITAGNNVEIKAGNKAELVGSVIKAENGEVKVDAKVVETSEVHDKGPDKSNIILDMIMQNPEQFVNIVKTVAKLPEYLSGQTSGISQGYKGLVDSGVDAKTAVQIVTNTAMNNALNTESNLKALKEYYGDKQIPAADRQAVLEGKTPVIKDGKVEFVEERVEIKVSESSDSAGLASQGVGEGVSQEGEGSSTTSLPANAGNPGSSSLKSSEGTSAISSSETTITPIKIKIVTTSETPTKIEDPETNYLYAKANAVYETVEQTGVSKDVVLKTVNLDAQTFGKFEEAKARK